MSLKLGNQEVTKVMLGSTEVSGIYKGADQVWTAEEPVVIEPIDDITEVFRAWPYTATNADPFKVVNEFNYNDKGGLLWVKCRNVALQSRIYDTERGFDQETTTPYGRGLSISSDKPDAQTTIGLREFNDDGFTTDNGPLNNANGWGYISWSFQKRAGFMDIVEYAGGQGRGAKIPHNLGCKPGMILVKRVSSSRDWRVYHSGIGADWAGVLNATSAFVESGDWNKEEPTDTHFSIGDSGNVNSSGQEYIAYVFADGALDGSIIKCGSYTGTGSNQSIDLGWKPQFLFVKDASNSTYNWWMYDEERGFDKLINANIPDQEMSGASYYTPTDTGFNSRNSSVTDRAGEKYIYMAIKAPPPPPPGPWGYDALNGKADCYFDLNNVTWPEDNWCVETWFKASGATHGNYASLFGIWTSQGDGGWMFGYNMNLDESTDNKLAVMHIRHNDTYQYSAVATNQLLEWSHVAMVKQGSSIYFYINGRLQKSVSTGGYYWGGKAAIYGCGSGIRSGATGVYSNFRLSDTVRYPNGTNFNVPSTHFEPDANTLVLSHYGSEIKDYSGNDCAANPDRNGKMIYDSPWTARDTYSQLANAQRKVAAVKEAVADKVKNSKDIKDDG